MSAKHAIRVLAPPRLGPFGCCLILAWLVLVCTGARAAEPDPALRQVFLKAWTAAPHSANPPDPPALRGYLLYPYLVARRLQARVADPGSDREIEAFLSAEGGSLAAQDLRQAWLRALARRGDWARFDRHYRGETGSELACHAVTARRAVAADDPSLASRAIELWLSGSSQPEACDPVFDWLREQALLSPALIAQRADLALTAGQPSLARYLARQLPAQDSAALLRSADYLENPSAAVQRFISGQTQALDTLALGKAWERIARARPEVAGGQLSALLRRIEATAAPAAEQEAAAALAHRGLGLGLALSRKSGAVDSFRRAGDEHLDPTAREWRIRAALWAGDWAQALRWIEALPAESAEQLRWRYWQARALQATGATEEARAAFENLALERDYHGFLAADRLQLEYRFNHQPLARDPEALAQLAAAPALVRAHELFALDLDRLAQREWAALLSGAEPAILVAAAQLAGDRGWHLQSISALAKAQLWDDLDLRYPLPYRSVVEDASAASGVPSAWIYGVMRQESLFRVDAVSVADARGLLQLLPSTAAQVARSIGRPPPKADDLFRPEINVPLGATYLKQTLARFDGRLIDALAAYNAGPTPAARWAADRRHEADVFVENIPYNETRQYLIRVTENIVTNAWRLGGPVPTISSLLDPVPEPVTASEAP